MVKLELKPHYLLFRGFIFLCMQLSKKYHEMFFIYNYSHFQYSFCIQPVLFAHLENVNKLWNNNRTVHVNEQNQTKKLKKTESCHIQIDHVFYCSIQPTIHAMASLKDGFIVWHQSKKEDFLSIIYHQHDVWSWPKSNFL